MGEDGGLGQLLRWHLNKNLTQKRSEKYERRFPPIITFQDRDAKFFGASSLRDAPRMRFGVRFILDRIGHILNEPRGTLKVK